MSAIDISGVDHPVLELVSDEAALRRALLQLVSVDAGLLGARGHVREAPAVVDHEAHHKVQPPLGRALGDGDGAGLVPVPAALGGAVLADLGREVPAGRGRVGGPAEGVPAGAGAGVVAAGDLVGALGGLGVGVPPRDVLEVGDVPDALGGKGGLHFVTKEVDAVGAFGLGEHLDNDLVGPVSGGQKGKREEKCATHSLFFCLFIYIYIITITFVIIFMNFIYLGKNDLYIYECVYICSYIWENLLSFFIFSSYIWEFLK